MAGEGAWLAAPGVPLGAALGVVTVAVVGTGASGAVCGVASADGAGEAGDPVAPVAASEGCRLGDGVAALPAPPLLPSPGIEVRA